MIEEENNFILEAFNNHMAQVTFDRLYSSNFWTSPPDESVDLIQTQNEKSTQVLASLTNFYKDLSELELDYAKRLNALVRKNGIDKLHITNNNSLLQLDDVIDPICKISDVHYSFGSKLLDQSLPLGELNAARKHESKDLEANLKSAWKELEILKSKCEKKSEKYKEVYTKLNSLKIQMMTMDLVETAKFKDRLSKLKNEMINVRSENWDLVKKYNSKLDDWNDLWWQSLSDYQKMEESKFKIMKSNLWDFANELSTICVEQDRLAENIRLSLQSTSLTREMKSYVEHNKTINNMVPKLVFVDYGKGEKDEVVSNNSPKFQIGEIPCLNKASVDSSTASHTPHMKTSSNGKRPAPPVITEVQEAEFQYLSKSKDTYALLQEEAQREAQEQKQQGQILRVGSKTNSDPSTYNKVMSEYSSNGTEGTSMLSDELTNDELSFDQNDESNFNNHNNGKLRKSMFTTSHANKLDSAEADRISQFDQLMKRVTSNETRKVSSSTLLKKSKSSTTFTNLLPNTNNLPSHSKEGFPVVDYCKSKYTYVATMVEELSFNKKDVLLILHKQPDGWWFAENFRTGDSGLAPSNYLVPL